MFIAQMFETDYLVAFALAQYIIGTAWVIYHLVNTVQSLQDDVIHLNRRIDDFNQKMNDDVASKKDNTAKAKDTAQLSNRVIALKCAAAVGRAESRLDHIEQDLELHLDKTFMLVGFQPYSGMPIYVTRHDDGSNVIVRDSVVEYWKSGQMPNFVGEQFTGEV